MVVRFTKNPPAAPADTLTCLRPDGSSTTGDMPRQGILPRAAIRFVVASALNWPDAFFGPIARGGTLDSAREKKRGSLAKLNRAQQCEALVECLEAGQWGGAMAPAAFAQKLRAACRRRGVSPPEVTAKELESLRAALREFGASWRPLAPGQFLERSFGA